MKSPTFRIGKYAIELIILIAGIMISFLLNEWRVSNQDQTEKKRLVQQFIEDLRSDTLQIAQHQQFIETVSASCRELMLADSLGELSTTSRNVAAMMNTISQKFTDATYIEASTTGKLGLIENNDLRYKLIKMYDQLHPEIYNWHAIDMNETLPKIMDYCNVHFPFAVQLDFTKLSKEQMGKLEKALMADEFKNLVQMNLIIKSGTMQTYLAKRKDTEELFQLLDEELAK